MTLQERYSELLAQMKLYLTQEYGLTARIFSEPESYTYFKTYALAQQKAKNKPLEKVQTVVADKPAPVKAATSCDTPNVDTIKPASVKAAASHRIPNEDPDKPAPVKAAATPATPIFTLENPSPVQLVDYADLRKILVEKLPHIPLLDHVPDDMEARNLANLWAQKRKSPQILLLSFDKTAKHQAFLDNIAKALEVHGFTAHVTNAMKLEYNNEWEEVLKSKELKLVVASSSGFYNLPCLQNFYREGTKQGHYYLGDSLLLLLSDISFYLKEPGLKSSLWRAVKELIKTSSAS